MAQMTKEVLYCKHDEHIPRAEDLFKDCNIHGNQWILGKDVISVSLPEQQPTAVQHQTQQIPLLLKIVSVKPNSDQERQAGVSEFSSLKIICSIFFELHMQMCMGPTLQYFCPRWRHARFPGRVSMFPSKQVYTLLLPAL